MEAQTQVRNTNIVKHQFPFWLGYRLTNTTFSSISIYQFLFDLSSFGTSVETKFKSNTANVNHQIFAQYSQTELSV